MNTEIKTIEPQSDPQPETKHKPLFRLDYKENP